MWQDCKHAVSIRNLETEIASAVRFHLDGLDGRLIAPTDNDTWHGASQGTSNDTGNLTLFFARSLTAWMNARLQAQAKMEFRLFVLGGRFFVPLFVTRRHCGQTYRLVQSKAVVLEPSLSVTG